MKFKLFIFDRVFLGSIYFNIIGIIGQAITTLIMLLLLLLILSNSYFSVIHLLQNEWDWIVKLSILVTFPVNFGLLLIDLFIRKHYLFSAPTNLLNSKDNLKSRLRAINNHNKHITYIFMYLIPVIMLFLVILDSLNLYFVEELRGEALRPAIMFVLPFSIALIVSHFLRIIVEFFFLLIRYTIQYRNV